MPPSEIVISMKDADIEMHTEPCGYRLSMHFDREHDANTILTFLNEIKSTASLIENVVVPNGEEDKNENNT